MCVCVRACVCARVCVCVVIFVNVCCLMFRVCSLCEGVSLGEISRRAREAGSSRMSLVSPEKLAVNYNDIITVAGLKLITVGMVTSARVFRL